MIGQRIKIKDPEHPSYRQIGVIVEEDIKLSPKVFGIYDKIRTIEEPERTFYAQKYQYKILSNETLSIPKQKKVQAGNELEGDTGGGV